MQAKRTEKQAAILPDVPAVYWRLHDITVSILHQLSLVIRSLSDLDLWRINPRIYSAGVRALARATGWRL